MSRTGERPARLSFSVPVFLVLVLTLHLYAPLVSAANMTSCLTACDEYDSNEDLTPHRQDWIEGTYDFTLQDTSTIRLDLVWAIREFNRTALGLDSIPAVQLALANDGLDAKDGAPADLIRDQFNTPLPNSPGVRVQDQLITEIDKSIEDSVESGFGSASSPMTDYVSSFTNDGVTVQCSIDELTDASDEGATTNNAFEPPICIQSSVDITLSPDTFNLASNSNLDLERAYQGLLVMGTEVTTMFDLVGLPGHKSSYSFNPPDYATIKSVDANGTRAARPGPPAYFAGEWEIDHRNAGENDDNLALPIEVEMVHRNRTDTSTVVIPDGEKALDLQIRLDLRVEEAASLDFIVALHYLDQETMSDWGISMMSVAERATMNQVTSDGIRLAYHNDIVDLSNITTQFPVNTIAEGISSTVAGMETIQMNPMTWVDTTSGEGISGPDGGLNFTHSTGCTEIVPPNKPLHYCVEGPKAMSYEHPVYLRTTSQPFSMRLLDIMKENNENEEVAEVLDVLSTEDFRRVMNSGIEFQTSLDSGFLAGIIPDNLPPSELTLEIILPDWIQTMDGSDRITLKESLNGDDELSISFSGVNQYDWRNVIKNENGDVACYSNQSTCIANVGGLDAMEFDFNEWDRSVSVEFALDASVALHRIGIPQDRIPTFENHSIGMEAIPSDLIRLGVDISSRLASPLTRTLNFSDYCTDEMKEYMPVCAENITFVFSSEGITAFVDRLGDVLTDFIHQTIAYYLETHSTKIKSVDLDAFVIEFSIGGIDAPDFVVSDNEGIFLSMKIPKVRFKMEVDGNLAEMWTGNFASAEYTLTTTNAVQNLILGPMASMVDSFSNALTSGIFSIFSPSGVNIPPERVTVPFFLTNSTVNEEFDVGWTGPFTVTMPKGLEFSYLNSSAGNIEIKEVDGRQQITYNVPYGEFEDDITFKFKVKWYFFFIQLWKYFGIVAILIVLAVRRRKKRKLRKKKIKNAAKAHSAHKVSINPTEFADLSGFHSKGIHGDMEALKDYQEDVAPPLPPTSSAMGDDRFD